MTKLNLEATSREQEIVKAYLEDNASETLAEKINNGTPVEKDGKQRQRYGKPQTDYDKGGARKVGENIYKPFEYAVAEDKHDKQCYYYQYKGKSVEKRKQAGLYIASGLFYIIHGIQPAHYRINALRGGP